jgi:hypothetical protein
MMVLAPESAAPCTLLSPTPPVPMTTTLAPTGTFAVFVTAPKPVRTPQASNAAHSNGTSLGIATTCEASTSAYSANAPVPKPWVIFVPSLAERSGLSSSRGKRVSQDP